ncbi:MAG TPA: hypothetical protein VF269_03350 [Rhodanobacteraceae bacterium]
MRVLTSLEQASVAGGRRLETGSGGVVAPDLKKAPPLAPSSTYHVIGFVSDAPPPGFGTWWDWDAMNSFYWESSGVGGGVDGGGGEPYSYNDGIHRVYATTATSKNGHNNPGDIMHKDSQGNYVLNTYATEQDGLDALAKLMDNNTYENLKIGNMGNTYCHDDADNPHQAENWENNVESYMANHGYANAATETPGEMSDAEFNTFLNAISVAEGNTNMG